METLAERNSRIIAQRSNDPPDEPDWCMALYGNHDEHQCRKKPGHWVCSFWVPKREAYCNEDFPTREMLETHMEIHA